ncbi:MAG: hypothetical protein CVU44_03245 [Chloroflexi bacterium HGW-Chloroflexi-6]|nr:MAG: hypothetical protein CVU44_03245 [Chloroflexi bacterium HGW-Chloroflexi-6]
MRGLYDCLVNWQNAAQEHILSLNIQQENENFCCIVLTNSQDLARTPLTLYQEDMARFRRKALKHIGVGVDFSTNEIKPEKILEIQIKLEKCKTPTEVKKVFLEAYSID